MQSPNKPLCFHQHLESTFQLQEQNKMIEDLMLNLKKTSEVTSGKMNLMKMTEAKWQMKHRLIQIMGYHKLLLLLKENYEVWELEDSVNSEEMLSEHANHKNHLKDLQKTIKEMELVLEDSGNVFAQRSEIDHELKQIQEKSEKYKKLKSELEQKQNSFEGNADTYADTSKLIESRKIIVAKKLQQLDALQCEILLFDINNQERSILNTLENYFTLNATDSNTSVMEKEHPVKVYEELSGLKVSSKSSDCDEVQVFYGPKMKFSVTLFIHYTKKKPPYPTRLTNIKLVHCNICVDDLISEAISDNCIYRFIIKLRKRLEMNKSLADEIEVLRKTSAIDWIPGENHLQLIVSPNIYTLLVPKGYPLAGEVEIYKVKGPHEQDLNLVKPLQKSLSLTEWVQHLELIGN